MNEDKRLEEEKYFDSIIQTSLINIYTLSKNNEYIQFNNFDIDNTAHLCLLNIATAARTIFNYPIYINTSFINFLKLKKYHKNLIELNHIKRKKRPNGIDTRVFEYDINVNFKDAGILSKIYERYYK